MPYRGCAAARPDVNAREIGITVRGRVRELGDLCVLACLSYSLNHMLVYSLWVARAFSMTSWPTGDESSMLMLAMINGNGTGDDEEYDDNDDVDDAALNDETLRKTMMG